MADVHLYEISDPPIVTSELTSLIKGTVTHLLNEYGWSRPVSAYIYVIPFLFMRMPRGFCL